MSQMYSKILFLVLIASSVTGFASTTANYFRVWQGFKKPSLSSLEFMGTLPKFMDDTVSLYDGYGALSNYIVVIPPKNKPSYVPDELALVGLASEEIYREIRQTPEGKAYSERHWDVFNKETSSSAKIFVDYTKEKPQALAHNAVYDMFGKHLDWSTGHNIVYIGLRKQQLDPQNFLANLKKHIELTKETLGPKGLRGYMVIANENYEVAYFNWVSKAAFEMANADSDSQVISSDAARFMDKLMFEEAKTYAPGDAVSENTAYSTMSNKELVSLLSTKFETSESVKDPMKYAELNSKSYSEGDTNSSNGWAGCDYSNDSTSNKPQIECSGTRTIFFHDGEDVISEFTCAYSFEYVPKNDNYLVVEENCD